MRTAFIEEHKELALEFENLNTRKNKVSGWIKKWNIDHPNAEVRHVEIFGEETRQATNEKDQETLVKREKKNISQTSVDAFYKRVASDNSLPAKFFRLMAVSGYRPQDIYSIEIDEEKS